MHGHGNRAEGRWGHTACSGGWRHGSVTGPSEQRWGVNGKAAGMFWTPCSGAQWCLPVGVHSGLGVGSGSGVVSGAGEAGPRRPT